MTAFISWYLLVTLMGWLTFPLTFVLFPALSDRGYALSRTVGMLLWGYSFWLLASLGISQNDIGGMVLALALTIAAGIWLLLKNRDKPDYDIFGFLKSNLPVILTTEFLFLAAFGFLAFVRSANPELNGTERPMELAFINAILRSPTFPPQDPWLSGYAISYYYFGYVMTAMLARLSGISGGVAHNLMTSLVFALGAVGAYGILYSILFSASSDKRKPSILSPLFAPLFLLLVSNLEAFLEVIHRLGWFWKRDSTGQLVSTFWQWLDLKELSIPPIFPFQWMPDRYLWWWRASRVIQDYDMIGNPLEVIDEFPFFSFLLGDLHPHVLAIPFGLLAVAASLHLLLGGWQGEVRLPWNARIHFNFVGFLFCAILLGGLSFLNTWDILPATALLIIAYGLRRKNEKGWRWEGLEELLLLAVPLGISAIVLYLPFYLGFSSQAGGILPNIMYSTRGIHLWIMWGTLLIPIFIYLFKLSMDSKKRASLHVLPTMMPGGIIPNWKLAILFAIPFVLLLWSFSWVLGWIASNVEPEFVRMFLEGQRMSAMELFSAASLRRLYRFGSLLTLLGLLIPALAFLLSQNLNKENNPEETQSLSLFPRQTSHQFVLLMIALGAILVITPEFIYLRDQFGYRINTIFKFYYQAWMLWSLSAAYAAAWLLQSFTGGKKIVFGILVTTVIFAGLLYPALGLINKTGSFNPPYGFSLDDFDRIKRENPDEAAAIKFLNTLPNGVIAEAVGGSYSSYARISTQTGLQSVLGWPGHEAQWRGGYAPQGSRSEDISRLYSTNRWEEAKSMVEKYDIRYIFVGSLEYATMPVREEKFREHLKLIFQQGSVSIYEVP